MEDVNCKKVLVEDFEECTCTSNVGAYVSAEWGFVPDDVAVTILFFLELDGRADCDEKESV